MEVLQHFSAQKRVHCRPHINGRPQDEPDQRLRDFSFTAEKESSWEEHTRQH